MGWSSEQAQAVFETLEGAFDGDGIAVAVTAIDADGPAFWRSAGLPEDARFEIGSITKTLTATLLASLVGDGVVALDDEIGRWLDAGPNADITLEQLATHTSGLPRLAPNQPTEETNPYRDFTAQRAEEGLRAATRTLDAGHVYSNFGYQLLGLVLERASGHGYQDLLAERLLGPLGMTCSGVGAAGGGTRMTGHAAGQPTGHWDFALPGPGAVEAAVGDLARYLSAGLAPPTGPLGAAIRLCQQPRVRMGGGNAGGLAWIITGGLLFHNGGTGGFSASVAIDQAAGHAVGALVNTHGRSVSLLDAAVITAVNGGDPRHARPQGIGETAGLEWEQRAREMAQALLDGKFTEIHQNLRPEGQAKQSAERLGQMWQFALRQIGDPGPVLVSCRSLADGMTASGEVAALITFAGSKRPLRLFVRFTASGQIASLRVLAPDEAAPW
jgi:D-alanyl-D-alanine-carboxypeptidase/D-alanyl-D-alanine-endopeptidase